jgi:formate hydrogenlyase subunit 4
MRFDRPRAPGEDLTEIEEGMILEPEGSDHALLSAARALQQSSSAAHRQRRKLG